MVVASVLETYKQEVVLVSRDAGDEFEQIPLKKDDLGGNDLESEITRVVIENANFYMK